MDFELTSEQVEIRDLIRRVAREKVVARANDIDRSAEYPQDMFDLLKSLELFTIPFPERYGGTNSMLTGCLAIEELGRVCFNTAYVLVMQWVPFDALMAAGSDRQKEKYLPGIGSGALRGSISVTEPQGGSDVAQIRTRADRVPNGYRLKGAKIWCTGASVADFIVVAARIGGDPSPRALNLFIVERGMPGFSVGKKEEKMGARGVPSCAIFFDDVFVPEGNRLGEEGKGFKLLMEAFNQMRPIVAARALGLAQGAIDHAVQYTSERHAFGKAVSDFQGIRWMLADMIMQTEAARLLTYRAASLVDKGSTGTELATAASIAKCFSTDVAMKVATDAAQMFGAAGVSGDYPINRYFRDAKVLQIIEETNQIQRNIIADRVLGRVKST